MNELPIGAIKTLSDQFVSFAIAIVIIIMLYKLWRKSEDAKDLIIKENSDLKGPVTRLIEEVREMIKELRIK